jgi:hypothetical protein
MPPPCALKPAAHQPSPKTALHHQAENPRAAHSRHRNKPSRSQKWSTEALAAGQSKPPPSRPIQTDLTAVRSRRSSAREPRRPEDRRAPTKPRARTRRSCPAATTPPSDGRSSPDRPRRADWSPEARNQHAEGAQGQAGSRATPVATTTGRHPPARAGRSTRAPAAASSPRGRRPGLLPPERRPPPPHADLPRRRARVPPPPPSAAGPAATAAEAGGSGGGWEQKEGAGGVAARVFPWRR